MTKRIVCGNLKLKVIIWDCLCSYPIIDQCCDVSLLSKDDQS
jgi:hypothetical protein